MFPPKTIVVGTDFSAGATAALAAAVELARASRGRIILAHVVSRAWARLLQIEEDLPADVNDEEVGHAGSELERSIAGIDGVELSTVVREGPVAAALLGLADANAADLLVVGTHGRTGFRRLVAGSVAETVVRQSAVPVLTVRGGVSPP